MRVTKVPFEKMFEFNTDNLPSRYRNRSSSSVDFQKSTPQPAVVPIMVPLVEPTTPLVKQNSTDEIPWVKIIVIGAIVVGVIYVGYRIYKKNKEEHMQTRN